MAQISSALRGLNEVSRQDLVNALRRSQQKMASPSSKIPDLEQIRKIIQTTPVSPVEIPVTKAENPKPSVPEVKPKPARATVDVLAELRKRQGVTSTEGPKRGVVSIVHPVPLAEDPANHEALDETPTKNVEPNEPPTHPL